MCVLDNLGYYETLGVFVGDVFVVYVVPIMFICYYAKKLFYQLHMPHLYGDQIVGFHDRSKKFVLMATLAILTYTFLLPERATFVFVKVTKISFDLATNVFIRLLIYLNCAFKPLLYGLLFREIYYPLLILIMGMRDARKPEVAHPGANADQGALYVDGAAAPAEEDEPSMTQEEYERRLAEEDQSKPSEVMIEVLREKVRKQKERDHRERLSSMGSSSNSLMYMRQYSDQSNGSGVNFYGGPPSSKNLRAPLMANPAMHRSVSCSDHPYPYLGRPRLHSASGTAGDPYMQQYTMHRHPNMANNFYTMGRGMAERQRKQQQMPSTHGHMAANLAQHRAAEQSGKLGGKQKSGEIPYYSQQNVYSTSPRKPRKKSSNSESLSAHGYDNIPTSQRLSAAKKDSVIRAKLERKSSRNSGDDKVSDAKLNTIEASPTGEEKTVVSVPVSPSTLEPCVGQLGEERSSSSSNGSACTEVTSVSGVSLSSNPPSTPTPTPPSLPPRSPTGVLLFETINEQSPFEFPCSAT